MNKQTNVDSPEVDDNFIDECNANSRSPESYQIELSDQTLNFTSVTLSDPVPLGRQILRAANLDHVEDYSLFAILPSGDFEDVRLDECFDIRGRGVERFIYFLTDREFKFTVENDQIQWGKPVISGTALYKLAKASDAEAVYLEVRGGEDRLINPSDLIDLTKSGIERFLKAPKKPVVFEIIVNTRLKTVTNPEVSYEQLVQLAYPGPLDPNVEFSISYRKASSKPHTGELSAGAAVTVKKEGTVFNVHRTIKS